MGRLNRLSARAVSTVTKDGRHADGGNLYLACTNGGSAKSWVFFYSRAGRQRELGLGSVNAVPLARAREIAQSYRLALAEGRDPASIRTARKILTFGESADQFIEAMHPSWSNPKHCAQWRMTLTRYAARIRNTPVSEVSTEDVLSVIKPLWLTKTETAGRLRGRIESVLDWAAVKGYRAGENPARWKGHLKSLLPERGQIAPVEHHPALAYRELPGFMQDLAAQEGTSARALEFTILNAVRTNATIGARWPEVDFEARMWTVPADRMKGKRGRKRDHRVPLSDRLMALLEQLPHTGEYIFPGNRPGKSLSNMAMLKTLERMGREDVTVHGFRSTFKDWASETTDYPNEMSEVALAHAVSDKTEAAYRRGDMLERRRQMMADWASFCSESKGKRAASLR